MLYVVNKELDSSFNLAFEEEVLLSELISEEPVFCLWRNPKSVIVGVSQVVENEVNLEYCRDNGIAVVRRHTGGGAVYHDLGNLNFSFFFPTKPADNPYLHVFSLLKPAFKKLGVEITTSKTNDMLIDGMKFSGMAERVIGNRVMVHGTLLYDTDLQVMAQALNTKNSKFNKPRGVASRRATVTNLKPFLKSVGSIEEFSMVLQDTLSDGDSQINVQMRDDFIEKVRDRAYRDYIPLNRIREIQKL